MTSGEQYNFQYCPKLVIFNDNNEVLLCKRQGEEDFDGIFSFPGGKREKIDSSIEEGIGREKNEELGNNAKIKVYRLFNIEKEYIKKAGDTMILPHYMGIYDRGDIELNHEYSEYRWIHISNISDINVIGTVPDVINDFLKLKETDFFNESFKDNIFYI